MKSFKDYIAEEIRPVGAVQPSNPDPQRGSGEGRQQGQGEAAPQSQEAPQRQPDVFTSSWHDSIRQNSFGLSPDAHHDALKYLDVIYKTGRDPYTSGIFLNSLHKLLTKNGVPENHPHMRHIQSMIEDGNEELMRRQNRKLMGQFEPPQTGQ